LAPEQLDSESVQRHLRWTAGIEIGLDEAAKLVPLVAASRQALRKLERFDVGGVSANNRFDLTFDPMLPYC
jgi:hypothetical protein